MEDLLNPNNTPSSLEKESEDFGSSSHISGADVAEVVKKLIRVKALEVDEICLDMYTKNM